MPLKVDLGKHPTNPTMNSNIDADIPQGALSSNLLIGV